MPSSCHSMILPNPINPRTPPNIRPDAISFFITYHQSLSFKSPNAIALMISEAACEPELPPLEMMSGTKSAKTTAFSISPS